jgi:hypothetical protein
MLPQVIIVCVNTDNKLQSSELISVSVPLNAHEEILTTSSLQAPHGLHSIR